MRKILTICLGISCLSSSPAFTESTAGTLPHATDFLTLPVQSGNMVGTTWYPTATSANRAIARQQLKSRKYTHLYLSVASSSHNYYSNPAGFRVFLHELNNDGIKPVVWLTSDTGSWKDQSMTAIKTNLSSIIPQIDDLVNSYCMGIEIEEYWTEAEADQIGNHLESLTDKPIAVHQRAGVSSYCSGNSYCDYMIFQYGFGLTAAQIKTMTTNIISRLGKPVVAGEYNLQGTEALSISLGNAAVSVGASGFGNGGTVYLGR